MAGVGHKPAREPNGHLGRFSALVKNGWLSVLTHGELKLWMAYEQHADPDGVAFPGGDTLAGLMGNASKSHVGEARKALADYGLIEILERGSGRGRTWRVRVLIPGHVDLPESSFGDAAGDPSGDPVGNEPEPVQTPGKGSVQKGSEAERFREAGTFSGRKVPDSGAERFPIEGGKVPDSGQKGSGFGERNKEELPKELSQELPRELGAGALAAGQVAAGAGDADPEASARYAALVTDWMRVAMPSHQRAPAFLATFGQWLAHLHERNGREPGGISLRRQISYLGSLTVEHATAVIDHSIRCNYAALHEPKGPGEANEKRRDDANQRRAERAAGQYAEPVGKLEAIARRREAERAARHQRDAGDGTRAAS